MLHARTTLFTKRVSHRRAQSCPLNTALETLTVRRNAGLAAWRRQIGFLYLRYVADPKTLYGWFEEYLTDEEEIQPSPDGRSYTIGTYVRDLMLEQVRGENGSRSLLKPKLALVRTVMRAALQCRERESACVSGVELMSRDRRVCPRQELVFGAADAEVHGRGGVCSTTLTRCSRVSRRWHDATSSRRYEHTLL